MGPIKNFWQVPTNVPTVRWQGGELLAWRLWRLCRWVPDGSLRLMSAFRDTVWDGPVLTADHLPIGVPNCGSGVYALKSALRPNRQYFDWLLGRDTWVRGWVALSGQVVEHERGYRAQRAVLRRLRLGVAAHRYFRSADDLAWVRDELERRYQCPVKTTGVDARLARGFASPVSLLAMQETPREPAVPPALPTPQPRSVLARVITPQVYGHARRRLREQIEGWRAGGDDVEIVRRPYYAGLWYVRAVLLINGVRLRVFFHRDFDRWRIA